MTKLRVLVVEDEVLIADYIALELEDAGHEVIGTPATANDALAILGSQSPDLVLCDISLKGDRDGIQLVDEMRSQGITSPHAFISGSGDPETRARAEATKPLAFLQKPFDYQKLITVLTKVPTFPSSKAESGNQQ
jgi:DNA-binding NtrC family response regulator